MAAAPIHSASCAASKRCSGRVASAGRNGPIDHRSGCHALVQELLQAHGRIDFLIHNAGWVEYQPLEAIEDDALEQMLCLAAKTPLWLAQAAWPAMRAAGGGRIVITTSDRALYPQYAQRGLSAYAMGKLAALGLVNVLALEGAEHGIVVNAVRRWQDAHVGHRG